GAVILGVGRVVAAELAVLRIFALDRECTAARNLPFEEEIGVPGRVVAPLYLSRKPNGKKVLGAVVGAIQVVAALRVPEIDLYASRPEHRLATRRGCPVVSAGRDLDLLE